MRKIPRLFRGILIVLLLTGLSILLYGLGYLELQGHAQEELKEEQNEISVPVVITKLQKIKITPETGIRFAVLGDPRGVDRIFSAQLSEAARRGASFAIVLGDLVPSNRAEYYFRFAESLEKAPLPVLVIPGNHDYGRPGKSRYQHLFGLTDYTFDFAGYRFIMLDNAEGRLTSAQLDWLEGKLRSPRPKFVFLHMPPSTIHQWAWHAFSEGAPRFTRLMDTYKPRHVFMSHIHAYDHLTRNGVEYTVTGGGGTGLTANLGAQLAFHHFILVTARHHTLTTTVVKSSNSR